MAWKYIPNYVFYSKSMSAIVNCDKIRKVLHLLNYLCYYAALVCSSCIFSHLFLGNRISLLLIEKYTVITRAWLYGKAFNKKNNVVVLFTK